MLYSTLISGITSNSFHQRTSENKTIQHKLPGLGPLSSDVLSEAEFHPEQYDTPGRVICINGADPSQSLTIHLDRINWKHPLELFLNVRRGIMSATELGEGVVSKRYVATNPEKITPFLLHLYFYPWSLLLVQQTWRMQLLQTSAETSRSNRYIELNVMETKWVNLSELHPWHLLNGAAVFKVTVFFMTGFKNILP